MAIITFSGSVTKGATTTAVLNKAELFSNATVVAAGLTQADVSKVIVEYVSDAGYQVKRLMFTISAAIASPAAPLTLSAKAKSAFAIRQIILEDFDGGRFALTGGNVPSGLGISASSPAGILSVTSDIMIHLDAASITGLSNGASVIGWTPKAGTSVQTWTVPSSNIWYTPTAPTYVASGINSKPAVRMAASTSSIAGPSGIRVTDGHTVFVMLSKIGTPTYSGNNAEDFKNAFWSQSCLPIVYGNEASYRYSMQFTTQSKLSMFTRSDVSPNNNSHQFRQFSTSSGPNHLIGWRWGYTTATPNESMLIDGQTLANPSSNLYGYNVNSPSGSSTYLNRGFGVESMAATNYKNSMRMVLGRTADGEYSSALPCDVYEMIVYNRVLTDAEMTSVRSYFNTKYALGY